METETLRSTESLAANLKTRSFNLDLRNLALLRQTNRKRLVIHLNNRAPMIRATERSYSPRSNSAIMVIIVDLEVGVPAASLDPLM
jgi:hypothetical protein